MSIITQVHNWQGRVVEEMEISSDVFGSPVRKDIITRVVLWQLAKRRSGNHKTKGISDISGTTRKPHRQKGSGRARQGSLRSPQFRGGAVIFGPVVRSHAYGLQKKVRQLGLRCALSAKIASGDLVVMGCFSLEEENRKDILRAIGEQTSLMVFAHPCVPLSRFVANVPGIDVLPQEGINVYDLMRHQKIFIEKDSIDYLTTRLTPQLKSQKHPC